MSSDVTHRSNGENTLPDLLRLRFDINDAIDSGTLSKRDEPFMVQMLAKLDRGLAPNASELRRIYDIMRAD